MAKDKNAAKAAKKQPVYAGCQRLEEVTVYDWMRKQNCKTTNYQHAETYPSIHPPVSKCSHEKTLEWMSDTMEATGCARISETDKDVVLDAWTRSPNKETLGWYGVSADDQDPEAALFNQALAKSLLVANGVNPNPPKQQKKPPKKQSKLDRKRKARPWGPYVLNRECLSSKLEKMPTVRRKLSASQAFTWLHCPPRDPQSPPFEDNSPPPIPLSRALGMERTPKKRKHVLRHRMCHFSCDQPKNECTDYEWKVYKENPRPIDEAFKREQEAAQPPTEEEPKDYDELYSGLIHCFEKSRKPNDMCQVFEKCCKKPGDPPTQGCGEMVPDFGDCRAGGKCDRDGREGGDGDKKCDGDGKRKVGRGGKRGKDEKGKEDGKKKGDGKERRKQREGTHGDDHVDDGMVKDDHCHGDGTGDRPVGKDKGDRKVKAKCDGKGDGKDRPCEVCVCEVYCKKKLPDLPLIREMRRRDKVRRQMHHRQLLEYRAAEYRAPQHKCEPIVCCDRFRRNPLLQDHLSMIAAVKQLQKQFLRCNKSLEKLKMNLCHRFQMPQRC